MPQLAESSSDDGDGGGERVSLINALVAQALDDIEDGRLEVEAALRMAVEVAWRAGYQAGSRPPGDG